MTPSQIEIDVRRQSFRVPRRAFCDAEIFDRERSAIFDRCWLYAGHETELPEAGSFLRRTVAGRQLLLLRTGEGTVRCFLNVCPHRGAMVCREKSGRRDRFTCIYHGWTFSNQGTLIGLPGKETYGECFNARGEVNLVAVPRLESHAGFIFVNFDREACPLQEYLAGAAEYLELIADMSVAGMNVVGGTQEYSIRANWKLLAENSLDIYHGPSLHTSYLDYLSVANPARAQPLDGLSGEARDLGNGHGVVEYFGPWGRPLADWAPMLGDHNRGEIEEVFSRLVERCGEQRASRMAKRSRNLLIFPNLAIVDITSLAIRSIQPVRPGYMEVYAWALAPADESAALRERRLYNYLEFLGPGGFATPDDIEALETCQIGFESCGRDAPWNEVSKGMGRVEHDWFDEVQMRAFWSEWDRRIST